MTKFSLPQRVKAVGESLPRQFLNRIENHAVRSSFNATTTAPARLGGFSQVIDGLFRYADGLARGRGGLAAWAYRVRRGGRGREDRASYVAIDVEAYGFTMGAREFFQVAPPNVADILRIQRWSPLFVKSSSERESTTFRFHIPDTQLAGYEARKTPAKARYELHKALLQGDWFVPVSGILSMARTRRGILTIHDRRVILSGSLVHDDILQIFPGLFHGRFEDLEDATILEGALFQSYACGLLFEGLQLDIGSRYRMGGSRSSPHWFPAQERDRSLLTWIEQSPVLMWAATAYIGRTWFSDYIDTPIFDPGAPLGDHRPHWEWLRSVFTGL